MLIGLFNAIKTGAISKEEAFSDDNNKVEEQPIFRKKEGNE